MTKRTARNILTQMRQCNLAGTTILFLLPDLQPLTRRLVRRAERRLQHKGRIYGRASS